jgi:hypothetical protein
LNYGFRGKIRATERLNPPAPSVFLFLRLQREALFLAGGAK